MSFRTFASGSDNFHFVRDNCIDQDFFDSIDLINKLSSFDGTGMGALGTGADIALPSAGIVDLMTTVATMEFLHNLNNAVCFLAMKTSPGNGWISLSTRESNILWPDSVTFSQYRFSPGDSPGAEFIRLITPKLEETNMNSWGVIRMIGAVLALYCNRLGSTSTPMINIQLSK